MNISTTQLSNRISKLAKTLEQNDISYAVFVPGPNFYFLTGLNFHLMERPTLLVVQNTGAVSAIIPSLEKTQWQKRMPDVESHYWNDSEGFAGAFLKLFANMKGKVAVEGLRMRVREKNAILEANPKLEIVDGQEVISSIRLQKDSSEIEIVKQAISISETALHQLLPTISLGMTEKEAKQKLIISLLENGADGLAFDPIVLFGAAAADCHGHSSESRKLNAGDAILIDFGAAYGGYNADMTRTFFAKSCDDQSREIYETVLAANILGNKIAKAGLTASELDEAVTGVLVDSPFKDCIAHKTGHGLGIDVHEWPQIMVGNHQVLEEGMLFTIEPGLYKAGSIGVRIEDNVLIDENGSTSLTTFPKELTILSI